MPTKDNALPENSKENLEQKLDHAIKETFPSSDPVSVSVTKGGAINYDSQDAAASAARGSLGQEGQSTAENLLGQARDTVGRAVLPRGHPNCASVRCRESVANSARRRRHWLRARLDGPQRRV
jgi:hypothetical protein